MTKRACRRRHLLSSVRVCVDMRSSGSVEFERGSVLLRLARGDALERVFAGESFFHRFGKASEPDPRADPAAPCFETGLFYNCALCQARAWREKDRHPGLVFCNRTRLLKRTMIDDVFMYPVHGENSTIRTVEAICPGTKAEVLPRVIRRTLKAVQAQ